MVIYDLDSMNESEEVLDNMLEACEYMADMIDESSAAQRHFGATSKDYKEYDIDPELKGIEKSKAYRNAVTKQTANLFNNGKAEKRVNDIINGKGVGRFLKGSIGDLSDREKEEAKVAAMALMKGAAGYKGSLYAKHGTDVKDIYDKAAKKKAIKETCLYILSALDDIE